MIYLFPRHMRMGQPVITAVTSDDYGYRLVIYHSLGYDYRQGQLVPKAINGTGKAYKASNSVRISKEFYENFLAEAKKNKTTYRKNKNETT